ncbi:TPA: hypothetical protein R4286_001965 [Raoultella ornithinolytica]|nr:hypothetical protein [Raoultella ornithinolytica]HED4188168.1 hypothetical protein [Raoultella ornithinolytica]
MTKSTITRERVVALIAEHSYDSALVDALEHLLAAMDSEPVAFIARYESGAIHGTCDRDDPVKMEWLKRGMDVSPLYAAPQLPQPAAVSEKIIDNFEEEFRRAFEVSAAVEQLIEIGYQGDKFSLSIRDAATLWKLGRAAMLQAGNCRENANSSTNNCREIPETSTNRSREHFISLCNEFWNWSEMDEVCAEDRGYELRMEWDGKVFKHPVTQALWRMYQVAPQEVK